jgi:uncharacterized protein (TIRG00374 family)
MKSSSTEPSVDAETEAHAEATPPKAGLNLRKAVAMMCAAVVLYFGISLYRGFDKMGESLSRFQASAFALACALALGNYLLRFLKWEFYLAKLGVRGIPKVDSLLIYLSGFVLTVTPGKVGEVFKSAILDERFGVPTARTAPIVVAERVTDVLGVVVLISIGSVGFAGGALWAGAGLALVLVILGVLASRKLSLALIGLVRKLPRGDKLAPKFLESYESLTVLVLPKNLVWPTVLSVAAWFLECLALFVILRGFGQTPPLPPCLFSYATSTLAGAILPVGPTEAALLKQMVVLCKIEESLSTAAMILVRFSTLWFAVLVGFLALGALRFRKPGRTQPQGTTA